MKWTLHQMHEYKGKKIEPQSSLHDFNLVQSVLSVCQPFPFVIHVCRLHHIRLCHNGTTSLQKQRRKTNKKTLTKQTQIRTMWHWFFFLSKRLNFWNPAQAKSSSIKSQWWTTFCGFAFCVVHLIWRLFHTASYIKKKKESCKHLEM